MEFIVNTKSRPIIPIVPLIDILAILLIFFMLTTTFKEQKDYLPLDLPKVTHLQTTASVEKRLALEVSENGEMRLADAPIDTRSLGLALRQLREALPNAKLELRADDQVPLQTLLEIWEALAKADFPIKEVPVRVQVHLQDK